MKRIIPVLIVVAACGGDSSSTQCKAMLLPGDLVITEIFADYAAPAGSSGADTGKEWFEVYNASSRPIDLQGVVLTLSRPDGTSPHTHTMSEATIAPGQYLTLGDVDPAQLPAWVDYGYADELGEMFNTNGGKLAIACNGTEVDHAIYNDVSSGHSQQLDGQTAPDYTTNDDLTRWCPADELSSPEFDPSNFGTPRAANQACMVIATGMCNDGGTMRTTVPPAVGDLVITEVHPNPSGADTTQEWFELYAVNTVDLNGLKAARSTGTMYPLTPPGAADDCIRADAGTYLVIAKSAVAADNGNLPKVDALFNANLSLVDSGDLRVVDGVGTVIDTVTWTNAASAATRQLDPDFLDASANDQEADWCDATTSWFQGPPPGDKGSPGAVNEQCAVVPPPGQCLDNGTPRAVVPPTVGQLVITEVFANNTGTSDTKHDWFEVRANAPVDLNDSQIGRNTGAPTKLLSSTCVHLDAGQYALFAGSKDMSLNGGLTNVDFAFTSFSLIETSGGDVHISDPQGALIDAVTWTAIQDGKGRQLSSNLIAQPDAATTNDTTSSPTWCNATHVYNGVDTGTPKADNDVQCP